MKILNKILSIVLLSVVLSSCQKDFLETAPTNALSSDVVFTSMEGANLALNGMYRYFYAYHANHDRFGHMANILEMDLMGDDMVLHSAGYGWFRNQYAWVTHRNPDFTVVWERWRHYYALINNANIIILYIDDVDGPSAEKNNIKAQALSVRAFAYYQLLQLYAPSYTLFPSGNGIPLYTEPSQEGNPRSSAADVYAQVETDLADAIGLFAGNNVQAHRSHVNLAVANGLRARVALAKGDYPTALTHAQNAIQVAESTGRSLFSPGQVFVANESFAVPSAVNVGSGFNTITASEWLWGSEIIEDQATIFGSFMSHMDARFLSYAQLGLQKKVSPALYDQIAETDARKSHWVAPGMGAGALVDYNQVKFGVKAVGTWSADYVYMRLAEMYLIKAEAQARGAGSDAQAAQTLFELVSKRDPEYVLSTNTGDALKEEIMFHRRVELWGEGFRWIDLKRLGLALDRNDKGHVASLAQVMEMPAGDNRWVWKIPTAEFDANDKLDADTDQNP
ncbi:MAG: RagB/SusD family nutrient uptake outer membrane protein [Bacteroidales bacterium]|nr:RagB/SusD family nutrient uptake outer membrane protein [Bacteroidales bacterium]